MKIVEATEGKALHDWMRVPWRIYADDKNWVPHLKQDVEKVFDPTKNKLLQAREDRKAGAIKRWVLYDDSGKAAGRIAAFIDPKTAWTREAATHRRHAVSSSASMTRQARTCCSTPPAIG
jgi:hypothetical protein